MLYNNFFMPGLPKTWKLFQEFHKGKKVEKCCSRDTQLILDKVKSKVGDHSRG